MLPASSCYRKITYLRKTFLFAISFCANTNIKHLEYRNDFFVLCPNSIKQIFVVIFDMATFHINIFLKVLYIKNLPRNLHKIKGKGWHYGCIFLLCCFYFPFEIPFLCATFHLREIYLLHECCTAVLKMSLNKYNSSWIMLHSCSID